MKRGPSKRNSSISPAKKVKIFNQIEDPETELKDACWNGVVQKIDVILNEFPYLLNLEDDFGRTPLYWAVTNGKLDAVKALVQIGADINLSDNDGILLLDCATDPKIKRFLLKNGADANAARLHDIHKAAIDGDLIKVQQILLAQKTKINMPDGTGWSPLYWAAYKQHQHIVEYLMDNGAELHSYNDDQFNLIDVAELENGPTPLSAYLKKRIGFSNKKLVNFARGFESLVKDQLNIAKQSNKTLLIIFSELHGYYKIYQLQEKLLTVLKQLDINTFLDESNQEENEYPIVQYAKNNLAMTVVPVDMHPDRSVASVHERNVVIAQEISKVERHAFLITGAEHVYGLLKNMTSKINPNQFHIVPINLTNIVSSYQNDMPEITFVKNRQNVVQVQNNTFTDPKAVVEKWNSNEVFDKRQCEFTPLLKTKRKSKRPAVKPQNKRANSGSGKASDNLGSPSKKGSPDISRVKFRSLRHSRGLSLASN